MLDNYGLTDAIGKDKIFATARDLTDAYKAGRHAVFDTDATGLEWGL